MIIAQISDTHIKPAGTLAYNVVDTAPYLERAVVQILKFEPRPDLVIATGDLVDGGKPEEYARLRERLAPLPMPVLLLAGNHDHRDNLRAAFPEHRYLGRDGFLQYAIEDWPLRIIGLDTLVPGEGRGELCAERLDWLDRTLAARPAAPTFVMMHHAPFKTDVTHMDKVGLTGTKDFIKVIAKHNQVERIVCGHLHRAMTVRIASTFVQSCPSTAHQVVFDIRPGATAVFNLETPGFMIHKWDAEDGLRSTVLPIGEFPGPFPFNVAKK